MSLNFNVDPYYDDFDPAKNYHRILFKPGYAVQGRELTQSQTILQNQITNFADAIFAQNTPVSGGKITINQNVYYLKLNSTDSSGINVIAANFANGTIESSDGSIVAKVVATVESTTTSTGGVGDPPTLIVTYITGSNFSDNQTVYLVGSNYTATVATSSIGNASTGLSSIASISDGVFYVNGNFVAISQTTTILSKYSSTPSVRVGINAQETIITSTDDSTLLDPALNATNYQAPGADRYQISLTLETRPLQLGNDDTFVELVRLENGVIKKQVDSTVYSVIDDYFAKRTNDTNGDFVIGDYTLTPKSNTSSLSQYDLSISKGVAYVRGYRLENQSDVLITNDRARTTATVTNNPTFIDYGNYFYVNSANGVFDVTTMPSVDFHTVDAANVVLTNSTSYNSTKVATGYIRNMVYSSTSNTANGSAYIYKAYVFGLQNQTLSGTNASSSSNNQYITLPSTQVFSNVANAYYGVNITIDSGTSAGDSRTIVSYDGTSKVAFVNKPFTVKPDATSAFTLRFKTGDIDTIIKSTSGTPYVLTANATIDNSSRSYNSSLAPTVLQNSTAPELLFNLGSPYVSYANNTSYTTTQVFRNVAFTVSGGNIVATLTFGSAPVSTLSFLGSGTLSGDAVSQNFQIIVTNPGSNAGLKAGQNLPWNQGSRSCSITGSGATATFSTPSSDLTAFTATIIAKAFVKNGNDQSYVLKAKNLVTGNTAHVNFTGTAVGTNYNVDTTNGTVYIKAGGLVGPGQPQTLYITDVKQIRKIIDTGSPATTPSDAMLTGAGYDVTSRFTFNNGQNDAYYGFASITLGIGQPAIQGNLLVILDYYNTTGGDGYYSVMSYLAPVSSSPENYANIPTYTSSGGSFYQLRDCLDFRPSLINAQSSFTFRTSSSGSNAAGAYIPQDLSVFESNYGYYLGRFDKLVLSKDKSFQVIQGTPATNPILPTEPDGSLVIANLYHDPYTSYIPSEAPSGTLPNLSIEKIKHKRWLMSDISDLESRVNNIEYYTALNTLEKSAASLQIPDSNGLNQFKNGIMVDDFSSYATSDTSNPDFYASINRRTKQMTAAQTVKNFPLQPLSLVYNMGQLDSTSANNLGYTISQSGSSNFVTLPYTTSNVVTQQIASRSVNLNPFAVSLNSGTLTLTPPMDNWVDTQKSPALLLVDPNLQVYQSSNNINVLSVGDWKTTVATTTDSVVSHTIGHGINPSPFGYVGYATHQTQTYSQQSQTTVLGPYDKLNSSYVQTNGYITDVSVLPYIRSQFVTFNSMGMLINTTVNAYFDGQSVNNYIRKPNVLELTGVSGSFMEGDIIGYYSAGNFTPIAKVIGYYNYPGTTNTRLYIIGDLGNPTYTVGGTIQNAQFNTSGQYQSTTASATIGSYTHNGGAVYAVGSSTSITLSPNASSTDIYTGKTLYIINGTGIGQSATISAYNTSTKVVTLSSAISPAVGNIYSIGSLTTNEVGNVAGVFALPGSTFHTGQRTFRIDNSIAGNQGSATTFSEATFYASGLQTTQQGVNYAASIDSAAGTFTSTQTQTNVSSYNYYTPWDPVAQTFVIDKANYPNGVFINSIKLFFATKPSTGYAPVTLSIVGTSNGTPNGKVLDHSQVTLTSENIKTSTSPHYLDNTTYTTFTFDTPVYLETNTLYAVIVKCPTSNEYSLYTAKNGDTALASSVKNLPTDVTPANITKITSAPYVGSLFLSQNSQTWTADQNQSLMFVIDRCVFDTAVTPTVEFVVPNKLPTRKIVEQDISYYTNANSISGNITSFANTDVVVDAFNISTTDFLPTQSSISYNYQATLKSTYTQAPAAYVTPGKFGTPTYDDIYLTDGSGERVLVANSNTSFILNATLSSSDDAVSPIISDDGLSVYAIQWNINNMGLSNNQITINGGGTGYNANTIAVTITAANGFGSGATAAANVVNGVVQNIYIINTGSGYITTPTITITDSSTRSGNANANVVVTGETSATGGNGLAKYLTKKVVLDQGFDSGDLRVYFTAYRPPNTNIYVYYKVLSRSDTQVFETGNWQLMTLINNSGSIYSSTRNDTYEFVAAPGTNGVAQNYVSYVSNVTGTNYTNFNQFAIKVVLASSDNTFVPYLTDIRAIALPSSV